MGSLDSGTANRDQSPSLKSVRSSVRTFIAAPPYFITTVFPRNRCRYGSATLKIDTRSNAENDRTPASALDALTCAARTELGVDRMSSLALDLGPGVLRAARTAVGGTRDRDLGNTDVDVRAIGASEAIVSVFCGFLWEKGCLGPPGAEGMRVGERRVKTSLPVSFSGGGCATHS